MSNIKGLVIILLLVTISAFSQKKLQLSDVVGKRLFVQKSIPGLMSMKDGLNYTISENGTKIVKYNYKTGNKVEDLFDLTKIENPGFKEFSEYTFSDDETKILFTTRRHQLYRHSYTAEYFVWNRTTKEMTRLSEKGAQQLATFSPDGERVAFARNNNLFIKSLKLCAV